MGNFLRQLFKRLTTSKSKPNPFLRPPQLTYLEDRITPTTFTVNTNADSGTGSLRAAIDLANATPGDDIINFSITGTITLGSSLPNIVSASTSIIGSGGGTAGTVTIIGPGASSLIISGNNGVTNRDFNIFAIDTMGDLTISGVTVSGAQTYGNGGAFYNDGILNISNSTISGNSASYTNYANINAGSIKTGNGGGLFLASGTVTISNSTISGNTASYINSGIISTAGNIYAGTGGGISNFGATVTIFNSTISGNSASFITSSSGITTTSSSTSNYLGYGGGIFNNNSITIANSTISGNSTKTSTSNGTYNSYGGGIYNANGTNLDIANTIIANSTDGASMPIDDYAGGGAVVLIGSSTNANNIVTLDTNTDPNTNTSSWATEVSSANLKLGPLQNNRGPTFTIALGAGSAAIGAGNASISNDTNLANGLDQRGINRTTSDIGAYSFGIQVTTTAASGTGSLDAAITSANNTPGNDQISFNLTGTSPYTITLAGALPTILDATALINGGAPRGTLTINGLGASLLTIDGSLGGFSIFNIASGGNLTISGVTVSGAQTSGNGGGFNNSGTLTISNSTISSNSATQQGGGLFNLGILNVTNSTLSGNSATNGGGGGILNFGTATVTNSTLSGNSAGNGGGINNLLGTLFVNNSTLAGNTAFINGGGINTIGTSITDPGGTLIVTNSTFSGNTALSYGGGISNATATVNVTNSTFYGNSAYLSGGGISNATAVFNVTNSTFSGNSTSSSGGGGGISNSNSTLNINNTIITNSGNGGDYAVSGTGTVNGSATSNLVSQVDLTWATFKTSAEINLGPLQNNGGPTFTMALLNGSYAINRGNSTISNTAPINGLDQRGFARTTSDIGAYSYNFASAGDAVVSLDNSNQVVLTLSSSGTTLSDVHTSFNSVNNTLTITAATSGNLLTAPAAGITGITINNVSAANTITLDLNTLANFAGLVIVGNSGLDSVTIGTGGVDLSAVTTGGANQSFTANILGTSTSTSSLVLTNAIKTKGTAATYLSAGTINGTGLITTSSITLAASTGIGNTTALNLAAASIAADSTEGKIDLNNTISSAVTVTSLTSAGKTDPSGALITFDQSGGGTVTFNTVSSAGSVDGYGVISLTNTGIGGGITVAGGSGVVSRIASTITLQTTQGGNILVNTLVDANFSDGRVELISNGSINVPGLITGGQAILRAQTGINVNAAMLYDFEISSLAGDITVANQDGISLQQYAIVAAGNVSLTAGQGIVLSKSITATGHTVTLTANDGDINGASLITANTVDLNATTGIGNTTALNLAAFFVSADTNAGAIDINNTSGTAVSVTSLTTTGSDGITFDQTGGGLINITGPVIPGTGALAISGSTINLNNNITTTNNSQTYTGNVVVNANSGGLPLTLSAGSGAIDITGNINSATGFNYSLTFTSTGDVTVGGNIGGVQALGALLITGNDISLGNIGGASAGTTQNVSVQTVDLNSDTASITLTGTTYKTTGQQFYNSSALASIIGTSIISSYDGTRPITLNGGSPGSTINLTTAGVGPNNAAEFTGLLDLNGRNLSINTTNNNVTTGGDITFNQTVNGVGTLTLNAGSIGKIIATGDIGATTPLTGVTITNAASAVFSGVINSDNITITDITDADIPFNILTNKGLVIFQGDLTITTGMTIAANGAYNVKMIGFSNTIAGVTTFGNSGSLTFGDAGTDTFNFTGGIIATAPSAIFLAGSVTAAGAGIITLGDSGTPLNVKSGNGAVGGASTGTITLGNAILEDGVTLTVGTGIANVINMAAVTGTELGTSSNLTLNTTGAVTVAGAVGTDIGTVTITNSGGTTFQSTVAAATATITNTTGTVKFEGNLNLTTSLVTAAQGYNVSITGTNNSIAGVTTFLNTGTVTLGNGTNNSTTFAGGLMITAPSSIAIQGTVATTNTTMTLGDAGTGVILGANTSLNAGTGNINLDGLVSGSFELTPTTSAPGITTISRANTNTTTNVTTGVVQINNSTASTTDFVVSGGTLKGTGTIRNLTATGSGIIAPGNSPGKITTTNLSLSSGNTLQIEIQGANSSPVAGADYDQIVVSSSGSVNLGGATLNLSSSFTGNQGTVFTIIDNQGNSPISTTFNGLAEGAVITANGRAYKISYRGGTGSNDVTLTVYDPATVTSFSPTIGKTGTSVVITGSNFTNVSQVSFNGTVQPTYTVNSPTQITTTVPSGATTGTISITTIVGTATSSSSFTVDSTAPTLSISANPGSLKANETSTITFTFSEVVTGFSSSIITVTNGTLSSPVASSSTVYTAIFTPTLGIKADGTIAVSNNYFDSVGNQGTAATLTPPIAINTIQTPLVTGSASTNQGGSSVVSLVDPDTGAIIGSAVPFPGFTGQIRVVSGDFNGDGKVDIIAAAGPGGGPAVAILDSETGEVMESFFAFDPAFTGGVFIAVRDFNGDGLLDIIAGAGAGGGPEVRIFSGNGLTVIRSFFAYAEDFTGGVSVASVDFNSDGILDLVTGAGPGGGPHVKVFDGASGNIISQWYAYPISFTGGVFVAAGDIGNDGNIEVVTGAGTGGAPVVAVWDPYTGALLSQFMAYAEDFTGGVRVGVSDGNFDGILDLVTGAGPGGGPEVKGFSFPTLDLLFSFFSGDPSSTGGVFVS